MQEELLDIVDESNRLAGRASRSMAHRTGLWHRGVHVLLFTRDARLLVQRRAASQDKHPDTLDCSVSEHLHAGEGYADGARRGMREELGLEAGSLRRLLQFRWEYGPGDNMISELFEGDVDPDAVRADPVEVSGITYMRLAQLKDPLEAKSGILAPWFAELLKWYLGRSSSLQTTWSAARLGR
jgi:isopentenyldiphosphate isomerase